MKKIRQIVYSREGENKIVKDFNIFEGKKIYRIGIQAPPGTKFYLNHYKDPSSSEEINTEFIIEINQYGIYELDLKEGLGVITSLVFYEGAYKNLDDNLNSTDEDNFHNQFFPSQTTENYTFYNKIYVDYIEEVD